MQLFLLLVVLAAVLPQVETVEDRVSTTLLKEPLWPAIPLQSPYQTTTHRSLPSADHASFYEDQTIQKSESLCYEVKLLIQLLIDFMQNYCATFLTVCTNSLLSRP